MSGSTTARRPQYGGPHQREKRRLNPIVERYGHQCMELVCLMPSRWMPVGTKPNQWDLAHNRATGGYLGPAHPRCNRGEGGRYARSKARRLSRWPL